MNRVRAFRPYLSALMLALVAGCGGGGGSPGTTHGGVTGGGSGSGGGGTTTPVVNKYVGTWVRCTATGATSTRQTLALNRTTDTTMVFSETDVSFNNTSCTGTGTGQVSSNGTILFVGTTKNIGSDVVDEVQIAVTGSSSTQNQVFVVRSSGNLFIGLTGTGATFDANGYPNALDPNGFTPQ
jgi:hypothetical protein